VYLFGAEKKEKTNHDYDLYLGKRRLNFANFITKERLNFPAVNRYRLDIMTLGDFMTGKLSAH
jgi:hypothetical protein